MVTPHCSIRKLKIQGGAIYGATSRAGSPNGSLPGSSGRANSSWTRSTTPQVSRCLSSSPASPCFSSNFEISSNQKPLYVYDSKIPLQILWVLCLHESSVTAFYYRTVCADSPTRQFGSSALGTGNNENTLIPSMRS